MRLGHCALSTNDPGALASFYERLLGLHRVGEAVTERIGAVFLSTDPGGPPHLQLMPNPESGHIAFEVDSLSQLRRLYAEAPALGARVVSLDHGPTLSFYARDPDGNACEVYWTTGRASFGRNRPIDLTMSEEELLELIRR